MDSATLAEIKKELKHQSEEELFKLCLKLAQYKKENKELISYLLFDSANEDLFKSKIKTAMEEGLQGMNQSSLYLAKKTIRKQLRIVNKYIKFSGNKQTEVELLLFFINELMNSGLNFKESIVLMNLLNRLKNAIHKALGKLHEDIQYDYRDQISRLNKSF